MDLNSQLLLVPRHKSGQAGSEGVNTNAFVSQVNPLIVALGFINSNSPLCWAKGKRDGDASLSSEDEITSFL